MVLVFDDTQLLLCDRNDEQNADYLVPDNYGCFTENGTKAAARKSWSESELERLGCCEVEAPEAKVPRELPERDPEMPDQVPTTATEYYANING